MTDSRILNARPPDPRGRCRLGLQAGYTELVLDSRGQGWYGNNLFGGTTDPDLNAGAAGTTALVAMGVADPDTYYYRRLITDAVRLLQVAAGHRLVDESRLFVAGGSQGGYLTLAAAGLAPSLGIELAGALPAESTWQNQSAYDAIFGSTPRLLLASFCAYLIGEFANAFVLARMKVLTDGRWLWTRTIGSTIVGQGLDSVVFVLIAFGGVFPTGVLQDMVVTNWVLKTAYETVMTPVTYLVVNKLKQAEGIDVFDRDTDFRPIAVGG